jgi:hypothetical protein
MPENCTILCPADDSPRVAGLVRGLVGDRGSVRVSGREAAWSSIAVEADGTSLVLSRLVRVRPGDRFSQLVLGTHNYFSRVRTRHKAVQADVLRRVGGMVLGVGVVAEPGFAEAAGHYDCLYGLAAALEAVIWTGDRVLNAEGRLLLDRAGNSEITS